VTGKQVESIAGLGMFLLTFGPIISVVVLSLLDLTLFRILPWLGGRLGITILRYTRSDLSGGKLRTIRARFVARTENDPMFLLGSRGLPVFYARRRGVFWFSQTALDRTKLCHYRGYLEDSKGEFRIVIKLRHTSAAWLLFAIVYAPIIFFAGFAGSRPGFPVFIVTLVFGLPLVGVIVAAALRIRRDRDAFRWLIDRFIDKEIKKMDRNGWSEPGVARRLHSRRIG